MESRFNLNMKIDNISEAQEAVAAIADFLHRFNQTLGALGNLTGKVNPQQSDSKTSCATTPPAPFGVVPKNTTATPKTMADRIFAILRESGKAMSPTEMTKRYTELGWPPPPNGKLYSALLSCAYYLSKKDRLKNDGGSYSISQQ